MSVSRRNFLRSSAALSAALFLKPGSFVLGQKKWSNNQLGTNTVASQLYCRATFEPLLGDTFHIRAGRQTIDLKLVALSDMKTESAEITTGKAGSTDCFSLRFHASAPLPSSSTAHTLEHKSLGSFGLFMTQSEAGSGFLLTAIVNQRV